MSRPEPVLENDFTAHLGQWVVLSSPQTWNDPVLRSDWKALVNGSDNLNVVYQSPEWFDHLQSMDEIDRLKLAVARDESGRYTGIIPLMLSNHSLDFRISSHSLGTLTIRDLFFLGGHFLAPPDQDSLDKLILTLADLFPSAKGP